MAAGKHRIERDLSVHDVPRKSLPVVELGKPEAARPTAMDAVLVYRSAKTRLSEYKLFVGKPADHKPAPDVFPYELNMPLFSDYTSKHRFIRVPERTQIQFRNEGVLEFPVGTLISKTFAYPRDMTDPTKGEQLLETRIELRRDEGWYGFSYLWDQDQSDARLALGGSELNVSWIHSDGTHRSNHYQIPNANQCLNCHQKGDRFVPIGPLAANLNRDFDFGHGPQNQLEFFRDREILGGLPAPAEIHAWPSMVESAEADVEDRARTWLHVNCAHCHSPDGTARTSGLDLRLSQTDRAKLGVWKPPVAAGHGSGGRSYDIVPGKPDESILVYRIESADPSIAMPSVAKRLVPLEAASLIRQWITGMEE